jgi:hypothetical protein
MSLNETGKVKHARTTPRRAVLFGAAAAAAGVAAEVVASALPAEAADGDVVTVGGAFTGTGSTTINSTGVGQTAAIWGASRATQGGFGLGGQADSPDGHGVHGLANGDQGTGVVGESAATASHGIGVLGWAKGANGDTRGVFGVSESPTGVGVSGVAGVDGIGVRGASATGVHGLGRVQGILGETDGGALGAGVFGRANLDTGTSRGVVGTARSAAGIGVFAEHTAAGRALAVQGQASFSTSGLVTIARGRSSVVVSPGFDIGPTSKVFVTLQSAGGTLRSAIKNDVANTFTISLTANATQTVSAAWFVIG